MAGKFYLFNTEVLKLQCSNGAYMLIESCCNNYTIWTYYNEHKSLHQCKAGELVKKVQWIKDNMQGKHGFVYGCF